MKQYSRKRHRREQYQAKLKRNYENHSGYPPVVTHEKLHRINGFLEWEKLPYYKRLYQNHGGKRKRYLKRLAAKKVRSFGDTLPKGNLYKKLFDLPWELD